MHQRDGIRYWDPQKFARILHGKSDEAQNSEGIHKTKPVKVRNILRPSNLAPILLSFNIKFTFCREIVKGLGDNIQGGFLNWPPLKSSKYKKVNLG